MLQRLDKEWFRHQGLLHHAGSIRLGILHANFGRLNAFSGSNCIPENRLFFAIDCCGRIEVDCAGDGVLTFDLTPGSITFVPANAKLRFDFSTGRLVGVHFFMEAFPGLDLFTDERPQQKCETGAESALEIHQLLSSEFSVSSMMRISARVMQAASSFASTPIEALSQQITLRDRYAELVQIVESQIDAQLTVEALAREMRLTRDQLSKRFRKDLGEPLKAFLTRMLVRKSCQLLANGNNIKTTAQILNFSDEFYFSKFFKKHTGNTPSEYIEVHFN